MALRRLAPDMVLFLFCVIIKILKKIKNMIKNIDNSFNRLYNTYVKNYLSLLDIKKMEEIHMKR